jgi:hypothetical protein
MNVLFNRPIRGVLNCALISSSLLLATARAQWRRTIRRGRCGWLARCSHRLGGGAARLRSKRLVRDASADGHAGTSHREITNDFLETAQAKELSEKLGIDVAGGTPKT